MASETHPNKDEQTYRWAALILRVGFYSSLACMAAGLLWWFLAGAPGGQGILTKALPIDRVLPELFSGNRLALMNLGIVLLLATPVTTIVGVLLTYVADRNWRFAAICVLIIAVIVLSLALSLKWIRVL